VKQTQFKNEDPPFWVAWHQALASIRVRFFRQLMTSMGIALGIAFFASILTLRIAEGASDVQAEQRMRWLIATSLVMCLVGVTNSMLMSVAERYREIGTIKCLGASDSFIVKVFFIEALLLGAVGSSIGAVLGTAFMSVMVRLSEKSVAFSQVGPIVLLGTLIGMLLTVSAAIAPAIQAARMPAAAALRVEV
jgi:predicted lysophospholipase L1 biosynthesis ABC-type transport system permease subunit